MNVRLFFFLALAAVAGLMSGCSKKNTLNPQPPANTHAATNSRALATQPPSIPSPKEKTTVSSQPQVDITTTPGFLGKGTNPEQESASMKSSLAREIEDGMSGETKLCTMSFTVQNVSGLTLYTTCFAYIKPRRFNRWRWRKSDILEIKPGQQAIVNIPTLDDPRDKHHVFGCLGVFTLRMDAENAIYESLRNEQKLDLDLLHDLAGKKVVIGIEKYGYQELFYDYDFVETQKKTHGELPELDFFVHNKTGKPILTCGFIYSKKAKGRWLATLEEKDDMSVWRFYKTKLLRLEPGQTGYIDVDTIFPLRDRSFVRGFLGVFDANDEEIAMKKTFESLTEKEMLDLGELTTRRGRTIILQVESYGVENDIIDFTVKPIHWIDFTKIVR